MQDYVYGYDHGCSCTTLSWSGEVAIPLSATPSRLRAWLVGPLGVSPIFLSTFDSRELQAKPRERRVRAILDLAIILSSYLLRQSGISTYGDGKVLHVELGTVKKGLQDIAFSVALPTYDQVPPDIFVKSYVNSLRLMIDRLTGLPP